MAVVNLERESASDSNVERSIDWSNPVVAEACTPKYQELIILPTEQCNFRCTYCYEDFAVGAMKEETQTSLERFLDRRVPELTHLHLSWFGGEPLAAKKPVLRIARHAKALCDRHDVDLSGAFTTNAWLLDRALLQELISLDQRFYQITLDGWGPEHDLYRRKANGDGTFDRIWSNLLDYRQVQGDFTVLLRIHVRRESWRFLETLLAAIAEHFGDDARFTLDFEHIRNFGGEGGKTVTNPLSRGELKEIEAVLSAFYTAQLQRAHPTLFSDATGDAGVPVQEEPAPLASEEPIRGESGHAVCYASRPNSLLIRADGRIGKCTVALTDVRNTIGRIRSDGSLELDNAKLQPWIRGLTSLDPSELACPLMGLGS